VYSTNVACSRSLLAESLDAEPKPKPKTPVAKSKGKSKKKKPKKAGRGGEWTMGMPLGMGFDAAVNAIPESPVKELEENQSLLSQLRNVSLDPPEEDSSQKTSEGRSTPLSISVSVSATARRTMLRNNLTNR
jgi:hypothetical protein